MEGQRPESVRLEEAPHLAPAERELVELSARRPELLPSADQKRGPELPHAIPVRNREDEPPTWGEHARCLGENAVRTGRVVLDDAE